jgi:predicted transcriptional regulator
MAGRDTESLDDLGELQREVIRLVWENAPVTAEAVRELLPRPLKDSTVRTVLRRLEEKGYITHTMDGRTFVYEPREPRGRIAARAVKRIVDSKMIDRRQLRRLLEKMDAPKAAKK